LVLSKLGEYWTMALMRDSRRHQQQFRTFNVNDDFSHEALGIDMVVRLPADRISHYLDQLAEYHAYPLRIRVDNGAEFTGNTFTY
jgi:putative transposase